MATLFLICGLPGAGKTTLAKQLEQAHSALRLCPDEWIATILADPNDIAERDRLRDPVEVLQWEMAKRALVLDTNVILENGFWSRAERDRYRAEAEALGARVELHYLAVSRDELWSRLSSRNANLPPGTFTVTEEDLDLWSSWFEAPTADEFVVPYNDFLRLENRQENWVPNEVVERVIVGNLTPIRAWREQLGLTQVEVAERMQISQAAFAQLEAPEAYPRKSTLQRVAQALGLQVEQLNF